MLSHSVLWPFGGSVSWGDAIPYAVLWGIFMLAQHFLTFARAERWCIFSSVALVSSNWFLRVLLCIPDRTSQFATQENVFFSQLSAFGAVLFKWVTPL